MKVLEDLKVILVTKLASKAASCDASIHNVLANIESELNKALNAVQTQNTSPQGRSPTMPHSSSAPICPSQSQPAPFSRVESASSAQSPPGLASHSHSQPTTPHLVSNAPHKSPRAVSLLHPHNSEGNALSAYAHTAIISTYLI